MAHLLLKALAALLVVGLFAMVVRDFMLGRVPAATNGFKVHYALRNETPGLFWLFTLGRAALIGVLALALLTSK